jgi:hypothetical protein
MRFFPLFPQSDTPRLRTDHLQRLNSALYMTLHDLNDLFQRLCVCAFDCIPARAFSVWVWLVFIVREKLVIGMRYINLYSPAKY